MQVYNTDLLTIKTISAISRKTSVNI